MTSGRHEHLGDRKRVGAPAVQPETVELELKADREQEKGDPELGQDVDHVDVADEAEPMRPDQGAGGKQTDNAAKARALESKSELSNLKSPRNARRCLWQRKPELLERAT